MSNYKFNLASQAVPKVKTNFRIINGEIPAPGTSETLERLNSFESRSMHGQMPIVWSSARDFTVTDIAGNSFIDFTSTIFVANVGHGNPHVIARVKEAMDRSLVSTYAYAHSLRADYLEELISFAGHKFEKAFLLSAGTESTEALLKLIRMESARRGKRRPGIISFTGNWHGRTLGAQQLSSNFTQKEWIGYSDPNVHFLTFPNPWDVNESSGADFLLSELQKLERFGVDLKQDIGGFVLETFQGWGALFYPKSFVQAISEVAKQFGILVAFDEMQSGFGRTGQKFGFEHYEIEPDLIACGKGMGGGFPLSGVLGSRQVMDLPEIGNMSSTHSANPIVCAAGLAVLEEIDAKSLVSKSKILGEVLHSKLREIKDDFPDEIFTVQGKGLIAAVIFNKTATFNGADFASEVCELAMQSGLLLVHTGRESIKIGPPLTISEAALNEGLEVLRNSLEIISKRWAR